MFRERSGIAAALALVALVAAAGCGSKREPMGVELQKQTRFQSEWKKYLQLPQFKAMAVAGDINGVYASGVSQGQSDWQVAVVEALKQCESRRKERGITQPCSTFAIGVPQPATAGPKP
jgi:hypothetical protein